MWKELRRSGTAAAFQKELSSFKEINEIAGVPETQELEDRYGIPDEERVGM